MLPCSAVCECEGDCAQLRGPVVATAALADTALIARVPAAMQLCMQCSHDVSASHAADSIEQTISSRGHGCRTVDVVVDRQDACK